MYKYSCGKNEGIVWLNTKTSENTGTNDGNNVTDDSHTSIKDNSNQSISNSYSTSSIP